MTAWGIHIQPFMTEQHYSCVKLHQAVKYSADLILNEITVNYDEKIVDAADVCTVKYKKEVFVLHTEQDLSANTGGNTAVSR